MDINRSFRWSDYGADRDVGVPDSITQYVNGWSINTYSRRVYKSWSSTVSHGDGWVGMKKDPCPHHRKGCAIQHQRKALKSIKALHGNEVAEAPYEIDQRNSSPTRSNNVITQPHRGEACAFLKISLPPLDLPNRRIKPARELRLRLTC